MSLLPSRIAASIHPVLLDFHNCYGCLRHAEEVSHASDVDDLYRVRQHFRLESAALLGHSWGAVPALKYALRPTAQMVRLKNCGHFAYLECAGRGPRRDRSGMGMLMDFAAALCGAA